MVTLPKDLGWLRARASKPAPHGTELQKAAQELFNHSPEFELHIVTNATKPPESVDCPWALVLTFSGSECSEAMRRLWLDSKLSPLFAKGRELSWPKLGLKAGQWPRPSTVNFDPKL